MKAILMMLAVLIGGSAVAQSDSAQYFREKGDADFQGRKFLTAYQHYQRALQFNNNQPEVSRNAGIAALEMRRYDDAKKAFQQVIAQLPTDPIAIEKLVELQFASRQWSEAIKSAEKAQQMGIGTKNDWIIAKSYYELENYGKSVAHIELAYRTDKQNAELPYLAGKCFIEMSNYKRAAGCYEQALALDSSKARWMYEAGLTYFAIPDDKKAVYWFEKASAAGLPRSNDFLDNLGNAYILNKQFEKGIPVLEELLAKKPHDIELLYNTGEAYYKGKRYQEAIDTWDRILKQDGKHAQSLYMIGMAYQKKGEESKGKALCDQAIAMDPSLNSLKQEIGSRM
jgi:tetratricopeptide (TPR) repeat protein